MVCASPHPSLERNLRSYHMDNLDCAPLGGMKLHALTCTKTLKGIHFSSTSSRESARNIAICRLARTR